MPSLLLSGVGVWCWGLVLGSGVGVWCVAIAAGSKISIADTARRLGRCLGSERPPSVIELERGVIVQTSSEHIAQCHVMSQRLRRFCFSDIVASCHVSSTPMLIVMYQRRRRFKTCCSDIVASCHVSSTSLMLAIYHSVRLDVC